MSTSDVVVQVAREASFSVPLLEVCTIEIAGPGTVTTGGGFAGGGFGVEGALEGIAIATVLNALTIKSKIHTLVTLTTNVGELHFHYSAMEPAALRMALAPTLTALRRLDPKWQETRLAVLEYERKYRGLSDDECERLKTRVLLSLADLAAQEENSLKRLGELARQEAEAARAAEDRLPKGVCPSCDETIPLVSLKCKHCGAMFGGGSAWSPRPK